MDNRRTVHKRKAVEAIVASRFTKPNPKLSNDMMAAATMPYMLEALRQVESSTVTFEYKWINRESRARTDNCVCLEVPITLSMREEKGWHEVPFALRLLLRDDTQQMITWITKPSDVPKTIVRKAAIEFRRRLRRSSAAKVKDLAKQWTPAGYIVAVELSVGEFAELVRAVSTEVH